MRLLLKILSVLSDTDTHGIFGWLMLQVKLHISVQMQSEYHIQSRVIPY